MDQPLIHLPVVDSTQAFLRRNPHLVGCAVLADHQTEGRGRRENRWESAAGAGLWMSAAMADPAEVPPGVLLQRAMTAAARVLDPEGRALGLKWPNDLAAWKAGRLVKVGGILGERIGPRLVLGLGVNLSAAPDLPDRAIPPASLMDLGLPFGDTRKLAGDIFNLWLNLNFNIQPLFRWPEPGEALRWEEGEGVCQGWEPDGRLKVATAEGIQRLSAGDIRGLG